MIRTLLLCVAMAAVVCAEATTGTIYGSIHPRTIQNIKRQAAMRKPDGSPATNTPYSSIGRVTIHQHTLSGEKAPGPVSVAITAMDGTFAFHNLPLGFYSMTVDSYNDLVFPTYQVEVLRSASGAVKCRVNDIERQPTPIRGGASPEDPVELEAIASYSYFIPREEYSIWSFFKNPMLLMMIFSFGMMGLMKLMPQEEMRQSMKEVSEAMDNGKKILNAGNK